MTPKYTPRVHRPRVWCYVVQEMPDGPVKIGMAINPVKRLRDLQAMNPHPLRLLRVYAGGGQTEKDLHTQFADRRIHGEWFDSTVARELRPSDRHGDCDPRHTEL